MHLDEHHQTEARCYDEMAEKKIQRAKENNEILRIKKRPSFCEVHDDLFCSLESVLPSFEGKKIIEIGSGDGELATWFSLNRGGTIISCDISPKNGELARFRLEKLYPNLRNRLSFITSPFEHLTLEPYVWDVIYGNVVLHHLKFEEATQKILELLAPQGIVAFIEPLAFSPFLQRVRSASFFKFFFPVRQETPTERILSLKDLEYLQRFFILRVIPHRWLFPLYQKIRPRVMPFRYTQWELKIVHGADAFFLRLFPFLRVVCRYAIITLHKK